MTDFHSLTRLDEIRMKKPSEIDSEDFYFVLGYLEDLLKDHHLLQDELESCEAEVEKRSKEE